jgi:hypothetical protein
LEEVTERVSWPLLGFSTLTSSSESLKV